jgi:copper transport protein
VIARWLIAGLVGAAAALAVAAPPAFAHASLVRTQPSASATLDRPPKRVDLTFSEPVGPRFAIVSVTDAAGHQRTTAGPSQVAGDDRSISVPVGNLSPGWYLVYWRVISADGHPVRGAFTFAVGPNAGPAPQFVIPSLTESAATTPLIAARWAAILSVMLAVGLFVLRALVARPAGAVDPDAMRRVEAGLAGAVAAGLVAIPVYLLLATSEFALESVWSIGSLVPLARSSSLGRALVDLEVVFALFGLAGGAALALDRPGRRERSAAAVLALLGALLAAGSLLLIPGIAGHPGQTAPVALSLALDWTHLLAGSVWIGGLAGLLLVAGRRRVSWWVLGRVVPRFSKVALGSVVVLVATGTGAAIVQLPTLPSLWETSYGQAILVKIALLLAAALLGAVNLARTTPRLSAGATRGDAVLGTSASGLLRRVVSGEVVLVAGIVLAAAVLTSLPPPPKAIAEVGAVDAHVGPGAVRRTVHSGGYDVTVAIVPNRAATPNAFQVRLSRGSRPVSGARVIARFLMLDMEMSTLAYTLPERSPGRYSRTAPALVMVGRWAVRFEITPPGGREFDVVLLDKAEG